MEVLPVLDQRNWWKIIRDLIMLSVVRYANDPSHGFCHFNHMYSAFPRSKEISSHPQLGLDHIHESSQSSRGAEVFNILTDSVAGILTSAAQKAEVITSGYLFAIFHC